MMVFNLSASTALRLPGIGVLHVTALCVGSVLGANCLSLWDRATRSNRKGQPSPVFSLGASGMVQGVLVFTALAVPFMPVSIMLTPIPVPLVVATGGSLVWDMWNLYQARRNGKNKPNWMGGLIGHAAQLGGAAFGAAFWLASRGHMYRQATPVRREPLALLLKYLYP
jgi:membrane associated rhomboid family serine protease